MMTKLVTVYAIIHGTCVGSKANFLHFDPNGEPDAREKLLDPACAQIAVDAEIASFDDPNEAVAAVRKPAVAALSKPAVAAVSKPAVAAIAKGDGLAPKGKGGRPKKIAVAPEKASETGTQGAANSEDSKDSASEADLLKSHTTGLGDDDADAPK